ncbi:MAG: hypothetical protein SFX18_06130 [Pirellulales bacterium]|nr:hypothetical protein [Pirellulales bacterium]
MPSYADNWPIDFSFLELRPANVTLQIWLKNSLEQRIVSATLIGPQSRYSQTLSTRYNFRVARQVRVMPDAWQVTCPDPCYWTPNLPFFYEIHLDVRDARQPEGPITSYRLPLALKRLSIGKQSLYCDGERTVLRGITLKLAELADELWPELRRKRVTVLSDAPTEEILRNCGDHGIPIIWDCRSQFPTDDQLRWARQQGALWGIWVKAKELIHSDWETEINPLFWWVELEADSEPRDLHSDVDFLTDFQTNLGIILAKANSIAAWQTCLKALKEMPFPRGIWTTAPADESDWTARRAACDRLQAEMAKQPNMAPQEDFSAYWVV